MYGIESRYTPLHSTDLLDRLVSRSPVSLEETFQLVYAFEASYGSFGFIPLDRANRQVGAYYLSLVSASGVRNYACEGSAAPHLFI